MGIFTRKSSSRVAEAPREDPPFQSVRRSPRNTRTSRPPLGEAADGTTPLDPARASKVRARNRLIGAVALALAAIVFVPMLFDRTPIPPRDDIALQIPDKDTPFEGRRGVPDAGRGPLKPSGDLPASSAATAPPTEAPPAEAMPSGAQPAIESGVSGGSSAEKPVERVEKPVEKPAKPSAEKAADKPVEKPAEKRVAEKPAEPKAAVTSSDDPRAVAALEGRSEAAVTTSEPAGRTYAVQIAAFSAADKARGLRDQLVANGLKSYTESVSTPQGLRIRVRLGPFTSRDAADHARSKLRTMKLDGSVVPL